MLLPRRHYTICHYPAMFSTLEPLVEGQPSSLADQLHQSAESRSPRGPAGSPRRVAQATAHFNGEVTRATSPVGLVPMSGAVGDPSNKATLKDIGLNCREHVCIINLL